MAFPPLIPILTVLGVAIISYLVIVASVDFGMMVAHMRGEYFEFGRSAARFLGQVLDILLLNGLGKLFSSYAPAKEAVEYLAYAMRGTKTGLRNTFQKLNLYIHVVTETGVAIQNG
ncbi:MAG: hypothetical protein R3A11_04785 [Bdellovibrionota bacterium]